MASQDMKAAEQTYAGFINAVKWSVPILALITFAVVIDISN